MNSCQKFPRGQNAHPEAIKKCRTEGARRANKASITPDLVKKGAIEAELTQIETLGKRALDWLRAQSPRFTQLAFALLSTGWKAQLGMNSTETFVNESIRMRTIPSVLVIDDNFEALKALTSLMTALGAQTVREAESAEEALELVKTQNFDLIVSDYRLEGMNGVEFLEKVRAEGNRTPVLVLSGAPDKAGVIRTTKQPKADFFTKPFKIVELTDAMDRLLAA